MINFKQLWFSWTKTGRISDQYELEGKKVIGSGKYGQVVRVKDRSNNRIYRAMRIIPKSKVRNPDRFKQEVNSLRNINHQNVIRLYDAFEDVRNLYIIMDLCEGGSLYEKILEKHILTFAEARQIFFQMVQGVNICHKYALCHKDIRPESFLYVSRKPEDISLKAVDFSFQLLYVDDYIKKKNGVLVESSRTGKLYYTSPEIFGGRVNEKCDIWSLGVILHVLITGELPFCGADDNEIYEKIEKCEVSNKVEGVAGDLISKILVKAEKRLHPWFTEELDPKLCLNLNFKAMKSLSAQNQLQRIMMNFISEQVEQEQLTELTQIFEDLDKNGNGLIQVDQLKKKLGSLQQYAEIYSLLQYVQSEDGVINYLDFQNQILEKRVFLKEERIYSAFKQFDLNNTGKITRDDLWDVLTQINQFSHISKDFCEDLISEVDKNQDGKIDYLEFIDMFFKKKQ